MTKCPREQQLAGILLYGLRKRGLEGAGGAVSDGAGRSGAEEDHPVRVIDAFVAGLDLGALGFAKARTAATGRPPYDPGAIFLDFTCTGI
jgi:hypothetical protein